MRFLVVTLPRETIPPEMALGLFEALSGWAKDLQSKGKIEQTWGFAGIQGGGGILNVESLEELDAIMTSFPLAAFSTIDVYGLVDLEPSLERGREAIRSMMRPGG
jgi:muconolactone delta-isomerase